MSSDFVTDANGKVIATILNREIFRDEEAEEKIAIVLNGNVYDLLGNLVGRLQGRRVIEMRPVSFSSLLNSPFEPTPPEQKSKPRDGLNT